MATEVRPEDSYINPTDVALKYILQRLKSEPYAFRFFQAVWLLERLQSSRVSVGGASDPSEEVVRFTAHASLSFPASEIYGIDWSSDPPRMCVNFMGLTGPMGVLPAVYTELIEERARRQDYSFRDFLDIFNHRLVSLFYSAWKRSHFAINTSRYRRCLMSLVGLGTSSLERRQVVEDDSFLFYSGLLALQPRSAVSLERILEEYFGVPAQVEQFTGAWYRLGRDSTFRFDETEDPDSTLGVGTIVGDEVWDQGSRVTIHIGPLSIEQYLQFLPGRPANRKLRDITRFFSREELDFEVRLVLVKEDVPPCDLNHGVQLGWTTWIHNRPEFPRNPADTVLVLE